MIVATALIAASIVALAIGLAGLADFRARILQEQTDARAARLSAYALMQASIDVETGQRGFLLTNDAAFLAPYNEGRAEAMRHLAALRAATRTQADLQEEVGRTEALAVRAFEQLETPLERRLSQTALRQAVRTSKATMDELRGAVRALTGDIERLVEETREAERRATRRLYWLSGTLALLAMIAVAVTGWALYRERKIWRANLDALDAARNAAEDARDRAAASDLAKSRFLAVASHDMRQPLHALSLYLSALDRRIDNPEARGILTKMERATDSMIAMFSTLLDLARVQAGAIAPEITDFALQDVFDRLAAENPGGNVEVKPTSLHLHSDSTLIERALSNLIANALKHGGGRARLNARAMGERAEIIVADDGPGISPEDQERIFDEFVRLEQRADGLGLGLSIVRGIAQALEMPVELESSQGRGARFILRPRLSPEGAMDAPAATRAAHLGGAPALVVDDEQIAREAVASALIDIGARVETAADEAQALQTIDRGFAPRLLVMDLRIDGELQGIDIARRLCERITPAPHVIVITGDTAADTLALLQDSGFAWLIKPVNPRDLSQAVAAEMAAE